MTTPHAPGGARVLTVQWMGDYREAFQRLLAGGAETYYAQRYSVATAGEQARTFALYGILCLVCDERYDEVLPNGVRALGAGIDPARLDLATVVRRIDTVAPTHVVVTTPWVELIDDVLRRGIKVLPAFADTFALGAAGLSWPRKIVRAWRHSRRCRRLAELLNDPRVRWVGNHNVNACRDLVRIGVAADKVVPWDWPPPVRPDDYPPKERATADGSWQLVYAGSVEPAKGISDAVETVGELRHRGRNVRLRVIGRGVVGPFRKRAERLGVADAVDFAGLLPHAEVIAAMRAADVVLVPSRHEYPEAAPFVIYESLAVRTPLVVSDHPAFRGRVGEGVASLTVPERSPMSIADAVERLMSDPDLYRQMSESSAGVWAKLVCPVTREELVRRWVAGGPEDEAWLAANSLASGRYD